MGGNACIDTDPGQRTAPLRMNIDRFVARDYVSQQNEESGRCESNSVSLCARHFHEQHW